MSKIKVNAVRAIGGISSSITLIHGASSPSSFKTTNSGINVVGVVTASSLVGDGSGLTSLPLVTPRRGAGFAIAGVM